MKVGQVLVGFIYKRSISHWNNYQNLDFSPFKCYYKCDKINLPFNQSKNCVSKTHKPSTKTALACQICPLNFWPTNYACKTPSTIF